MLEHPEITWIERTGYPSWMQPTCEDCNSDWDYEDEMVHRKDGRSCVNCMDGMAPTACG